MANRKVAVLVGGLSKNAVSGRVANALMSMQTAGIDWQRVAIGDLPFYNQDLETAEPPSQWTRFRDEIRACDGVLFVTPEYNRGPPGAMKNAIDVGSRPPPQSVWNGKPCGIVSTSPGALGGFGANHVLRQNISYFAMPLLMQPEMYLSHADKMVGPDGKPTDQAREFWTKYLNAFAAWVERHAKTR
jgi:chromate reductase, NAD(P)H dehydrogenase (quinone)